MPINPRIKSFSKTKINKSDNLSFVYIIDEGKYLKKEIKKVQKIQLNIIASSKKIQIKKFIFILM